MRGRVAVAHALALLSGWMFSGGSYQSQPGPWRVKYRSRRAGRSMTKEV